MTLHLSIHVVWKMSPSMKIYDPGHIIWNSRPRNKLNLNISGSHHGVLKNNTANNILEISKFLLMYDT